jgi:hypothetical protein
MHVIKVPNLELQSCCDFKIYKRSDLERKLDYTKTVKPEELVFFRFTYTTHQFLVGEFFLVTSPLNICCN